MEQYPNLSYLFITWVWTNHIDKEYCIAHGIQIINRPWSNARAVADLAVRWILSHSRDAILAYQDMTQSNRKPRQEYCGRSLYELSYGFVWCGMISLTIWETLQWFGVKEWKYFDPYVSWDQLWISESTLNDISSSDCLIIWAPHTPQTHEMINQSVFKNLPDHAIVINVARGGLVHEDDLLQFLTSCPDCKYYTDVRQWEPKMTKILQQLIALPNYIVTPHIAAETHESQTKMHYFEQLA
jgi:D-3-phosphoglycerate dehydrogenase